VQLDATAADGGQPGHEQAIDRAICRACREHSDRRRATDRSTQRGADRRPIGCAGRECRAGDDAPG
jgi:hypothetical protein